MFYIKYLSCLCNSLLYFILRSFTELKTKCHVLKNCHMRIERIVLENHRYISVLRSNIIHKFSAYVKLTFRDLFKTCDHTKSR